MFRGCLAWKRQNPPFLAFPFVRTASHKTVRSHRFSLPSCESRALTGSVNQSIDGQYLRLCPHEPSLANQSIDPTGLVNPTANSKLGSISQSMTVSTLVSLASGLASQTISYLDYQISFFFGFETFPAVYNCFLYLNSFRPFLLLLYVDHPSTCYSPLFSKFGESTQGMAILKRREVDDGVRATLRFLSKVDLFPFLPILVQTIWRRIQAPQWTP